MNGESRLRRKPKSEDLDATPPPAEDGAGSRGRFSMTTLGDFFDTISVDRKELDLANFGKLLARLRKDELKFEQVGDDRWRAKWFNIEVGNVVVMEADDKLAIDFYLMEWDKDEVYRPVYEETDNGKIVDIKVDNAGEIVIEEVGNIWPVFMVKGVRAGLQELGVLGDETPTTMETSAEDSAGNGRSTHEIYVPKRPEILAKWKKAYPIIKETIRAKQEVYKRELGWGGADPPTWDDYVAAIRDEGVKYGEKNIKRIIKAGDAGLLE
jgi:hypothetical protein